MFNTTTSYDPLCFGRHEPQGHRVAKREVCAKPEHLPLMLILCDSEDKELHSHHRKLMHNALHPQTYNVCSMLISVGVCVWTQCKKAGYELYCHQINLPVIL